MSGILFIRDLAVVMVIAGGSAWICQRLRLSAVVGYLVAGMVIGPHTPPFALVADLDRVQTLAQLGLVFLIFSIGLNLSLNRLRNLGVSLGMATAIGAILLLNVGRLFGWLQGWTVTTSLFLSGMLMVSSSAIIGKVLEELNLTHERSGQAAMGMTVMEDAVAVVMLTLLTSLVQLGGNESAGLLPALGGLGSFVVFLLLLSLLFTPRLLAILARGVLPEVRTLVVVGLLLSLAWITVHAGYSLALGAFVFGAVVGSTRHKADIQRNFESLHQMFGAVFFVAVGMQVDVQAFAGAWPLAVAVAVTALLLRPVACALGLIAVGNTSRESIQAGLLLVPLGEFSFVIAMLGVDARVVPEQFYAVAVGASLLTSLAAPLLARKSESISQILVWHEPRWVSEWILFYHDWLWRLRSRQSTSVLWRLTRKRMIQIAVHILFVSALILLFSPLYAQAKELYGRNLFFPNDLPFLFWSAFGLLLLGPLIAIWRNLSALAMILAENATMGSRRQRRLQPLLEAAFRSVALVVLIAWLLALLPSGWSLLGAAGGVLLLLASVTVVFWRRFVHFHSRLEIELMSQFKQASRSASTSAWSEAWPTPAGDWDLDIRELALPGDSGLAGRTLGQLGVRRQYGCSVVGIDRQGYGIVNPNAETMVYPHDKLLLLGTPAQLTRASKELGTASSAGAAPTNLEELTTESELVPADSPIAGRTLAELDLIRRAGIQIGAIRRGRHRNLSPSGHDRLEAGDQLLVLGTHAQIKTFRGLLAPASGEPHFPS